MKKLIATMNMTIDGFCDHTVMMADEELHDHYTQLLIDGGVLLYGRTTYQLMQSYWPDLVKNPSGDKSMNDFAMAIDTIPKVVFSRTLKDSDPTISGWKTARLAKKGLKEEILELKQQPGNDILLGSPGLIAQCTKLNLIDEYQLCVHPVLAGSGLPLFKDIGDRAVLKLLKTKKFGSGAMLLYYDSIRKETNV